jgi:hypothetical protein
MSNAGLLWHQGGALLETAGMQTPLNAWQIEAILLK